MSKISCVHFPLCSGCSFIGEDYDLQKDRKIKSLQQYIQNFQEVTPDIEWISPASSHLRDRLDFIWDDGKLGLFSKSGSKVVDILECSQLSPALNTWYQEFRKIHWPIKRGSIRLRVGPQDEKGVWLDFANYDIKKLLEEKKILTSLMKLAVVEIGQKRKILKLEGQDLKLRDPEAHFWFESLYRGEKVPLYAYVGSFTQPSLAANQIILRKLRSWMQNLKSKKASEFGAGIGNLSLMILGEVEKLRVFENDALGIEAFQATLKEHSLLESRSADIEWNIGDYHKKHDLHFSKDEALIVNPPRSGLKAFLEDLEKSPSKPKAVLYMSCAPESWALDSAKLKSMEYKLQEVSIVDQFPQTPHYEILSLWLS